MHYRVDSVIGQGLIGAGGHPVNAGAEQVAQKGAHAAEGQPEHQTHDAQKHRYCKILARQHLIKGHAAGVLLTLVRLDHRIFAQVADEIVPGVAQGALPVGSGLFFQLHQGVLQQLLFVFRKVQAFQNGAVPLHQLGRRKAHGNSRPFGVVVDLVHNGVNASVHRVAAVVVAVLPAEIRAGRLFLIMGHVQRMADQFINALVFCRTDGNDRNAQLRLQRVDHHGAAVGPHLIHHIQGQHHGNAQFQQLQRQVEVALNVGGVHNVDDALGLFLQQKVPGHDLFIGIGRQAVNAGQVHHGGLHMAADLAVLSVHRYTGEVAHVLVGAGELVEQGGLSAVLVSGKSEDHTCFTSTSMFRASSFRRDRE